MREELERSMQTLQEFRQSRQKFEKECVQSLQKLAKDEQVIEKDLGRLMTSIIDLGALEEDVSEEWGSEGLGDK